MLLDTFRSFDSDFGIGTKPGTDDFEQRIKLTQTVLGVLARRGVIKARFEEQGGKRYPIGVGTYDQELMSKPLREILQPTA